MTTQRRMLSVTEFCNETGFARSTVYDAVERDEIAHARLGTAIRIPRSEIDRLVRGGAA